MSFNSVKNIVLAASVLAGVVACGGKNKNNLKIDGTYEVEKRSLVDSDNNEEIVQAKESSVVEISNNIMSIYTFSNDKKSVQVTTVKLDIKGKKLVGSKLINDDACSDMDASAENTIGSVSKVKGQLVISSFEGNGKGQLVLNEISAEKFAAATKDLKAGKLEKACVMNGTVLIKLGKIASTDDIAQSIGQSADTAISKDTDSSKDTNSSINESDLKSQDKASGEKEQSDLVSEVK